MRISPIAMAAALATVALMQPSAEAQNPIAVELLTPLAEFTDDVSIQIRNKFPDRRTDALNVRDASNIATVRVTFQPSAVFPWHTHPGPVLITVAEGDFVYALAEDCIHRWYPQGTAVIDAGFGNEHMAYNPSLSEETVVYATFLGVPDGGPLTILTEGPDPDVCPLPLP
jgi:hypothetical protein